MMSDHTIQTVETDELWRRWLSERRREDRNELVLRHLELVGVTCSNELPRLRWRGVVDRDDLQAAGTEGLIAAVETFDPRQGSFGAWARLRIRAAVLEELRRIDPVPRRARRAEREMAAGRGELEQRLGRTASLSEVIGAVDAKPSRVERDRVAMAAFGARRQPHSRPGGGSRTLEPVDPGMGPEESALERCEIDNIHAAIARLRPPVRLVVSRYAEGRTLGEIGSEAGWRGDTRACQLLAEGRKQLRAKGWGAATESGAA